jgi:hypothetical protein
MKAHGKFSLVRPVFLAKIFFNKYKTFQWLFLTVIKESLFPWEKRADGGFIFMRARENSSFMGIL